MNSNVKFRQLYVDEQLDSTNLRKISELVYETDPYIYPSLFRSKEDAILVLSRLFNSKKDMMFTTQNCFVAECNGRIVGIILWYEGSLLWDSCHLRDVANSSKVCLSEYFTMAEEQYFRSYSQVPKGTISLINICISAEQRNRKIGTKMLSAFLTEHKDTNMELYVLADNLIACKAYEKNGFRVTEKKQGFSVDNKDIMCLKMELKY